MAEANVAVLIDYENVGLEYIQQLLDQISDVGRVIVKRAYADWSAQRSKRDQLLELGVEAKHLFHSTRSGKNSSDILLAIDAVDLLYGAPVDTFVIVSSDSDFVPLVSKLRAAGKSVIGAGRRDGSSPTLVKSCDRYIFLDEVKAPTEQRRRPSPGQAVATPPVVRARGASIVVRALEASMDDQGQVVGSKLYQTMLRIDPSFSYKSLGHRNFTHFLDSSSEVRVTRRADGSDVIVQLDHTPEGDTNGSNVAVLAPGWDHGIDAAWARRQRQQFSGQSAGADAARVLGVPNLRASRFPSLDKLLGASPLLRANWRREGNAIIKN